MQAIALVGQIALQQLRIAAIRLGADVDAIAIAAETIIVDQIDGVAGLMGLVDEIEVEGVGSLGGEAERPGWQAGKPAGDALAVIVEGLDGFIGPRQMARVALLPSTPMSSDCAGIAMIDPPD